tara:strand:+ start:7517 stop:7960 length:444 start_codon:yes stop_codon:yes gene_type:complete
MGTAFYVYENISEYEKSYKGRRDEVVHESKISNMLLKPHYGKEPHLWVVSKSNPQPEKPRLERSIVHFRNGDCYGYTTGDELKIEDGKITFNAKTMQIEFLPKTLRKPELVFKVDRYYGNEMKSRKKITGTEKFYDTIMDRINIILN